MNPAILVGLVLTVIHTEATHCPLPPRNSLNGHLRTPKEQICDPCEQIFEPNSSFMQNCGDLVKNPYIKYAIRKKCDKTPVDNLDDFLLYLSNNFCSFDPPNEDCECDFCEMLFDPNSDFMQKCAFDFDQWTLDALRYKCESKDCSTHGLIVLEKYLAYYCASRGRAFKFPTCECDECVSFFEDGSDFMEMCGKFLDQTTLDNLFETCSVCMDSVDALFTFFQTVKTVCMDAGYLSFAPPICDCTDFCWHLFDPNRKFYQDCFKEFPFSKRLKLFKKCRAVHKDVALAQQFIAYLEYECYALTGEHVKVPTDCANCTQIDLILVVDVSDSVSKTEMIQQKIFIDAIVSTFGGDISDEETRIGIILFADTPDTLLELDDDNDPVSVDTAIASIEACDYPYGVCELGPYATDTPGALLLMISMFANPNPHGNQKVGIVITDGESNTGDLDAAIGLIPPEVMMIAVGIDAADPVEILALARDDPDKTFIAPAFAELTGKIQELRAELCP